MRGADAVVVGGGPAGTAAALALAARGARVVLLEREGAAQAKVGEILDSAIQRPLRDVGLWERFLACGSLRQSANLSCWGGAEPAFASPMTYAYGEGFLVDRAEFETMLWDAAAAAGIDARRGCRNVGASFPGNEAKVVWSGGTLVTPVLVDATGRAARIAPRERQRVDRMIGLLHYRQDSSAMAADPHLLIEATPDGWWYSAPLPGGRAVFAFMSDADLVPSAVGDRRQWVESQLAMAPLTRERNRAPGFDAPPVTRPAASERRVDTQHDCYVAVGDAAASYDPLTGAGVATAMARGAALGRLVGSSASVAMAIAKYRAAESAAWIGYLANRRRLYRRERRWLDAPFWARRHA